MTSFQIDLLIINTFTISVLTETEVIIIYKLCFLPVLLYDFPSIQKFT